MMKDKVILAEGCIYETGGMINDNVIVVGGTGCGKTMSVSEPRLLETKNSSLVLTVSKRKLVKKYTPLFLQRGYQVWDLNFVEPQKATVSYDPLAYISSYTDIRFLAQSIVKANPQKQKNTGADPYWDEAAISLLCAEIAYTMATKGETATFTDVLEMHDTLSFEEANGVIRTSLDVQFEYLKKKNPTHFAVTCWKSFKQLPIRTASCVFSALNTTLDNIFTAELREMIKQSKHVDFTSLASKKTILFVSVSPVNPALHTFVNMFYSQCFKSLFEFAERREDGMLPLPVHVLCDDFAVGGKIVGFEHFISIFREKGISVTLILQSETQLEAIYGEMEATTIINNADTYLYMGGMDLKTGRSISQRLNMPLDDVLYMPIGQVALFRRGQRPIVTQRYDIMTNTLYQAVTKEYEKNVLRAERQSA